MSIEVVATKPGLFGRLRDVGDVFDIETEAQMSDRWMLRTDTSEGKAFIKGIQGEDTRTLSARDKLTGERIAAGGVAEELAIQLDENRVLRERVAELEAEIDVLRGRQKAPEPSKGPSPAQAEKTTEEVAAEQQPKRVRRRTPLKPKD